MLDALEDLMDQVRGLREGDKPSLYVERCQADLDHIYDNYSLALQGWTNLLSRTDVFAPPIRRQIVHAYLSRERRDWSSLSSQEVERIEDLMEDNMREEPKSDHNIRLWFRAIRYSSRQDIDIALDRLSNWRAIGDSVESYFYIYVLHVMKAMDGSVIEREHADDLIKQSSTRSRNQPNRRRSYEWFGQGVGLRRLTHFSDLGEWGADEDFYQNTRRLVRVDGRVSKIHGPEKGIVELASCGLPAFFVPACFVPIFVFVNVLFLTGFGGSEFIHGQFSMAYDL